MRATDGARSRSWPAAVAPLVRRPDLWPTGLRVVRRLARPRWWARFPFLPLPDRRYWRFRTVTAYGDEAGSPAPEDVVAYLEWCRAWPAVVGR